MFRTRALALALAIAGCGSSQVADAPVVAPPSPSTMGIGTGAAGAISIPNAAGSGALPMVNNMTPPQAGATMTQGGTGAPPDVMTTAGTGVPPVVMNGGTGAPPAMAGTGAPPMVDDNMTPTIPSVTGDCPDFVDSTISYMGVTGITVVAGSKPSSPSAPMVFYWHGTGSTSGEYLFSATAVYQGVVAEGGVLISFQNTSGGDLLSGTFIFGASDFDIADQLLACAVQNHNIDPRRVFATGCSAGGLFSAAMAASRSSYMAAAAPNSGGFTVPVPFENNYTPALMTIHGAPGVDVVAVDFSTTSATADQAFKSRGGFVINCNHGGVHCGGGSLAPDIWEFFKAHPYGVSPHPWTSLPSGFNSSCEIYQ